jgi:hypothetical protein
MCACVGRWCRQEKVNFDREFDATHPPLAALPPSPSAAAVLEALAQAAQPPAVSAPILLLTALALNGRKWRWGGARWADDEVGGRCHRTQEYRVDPEDGYEYTREEFVEAYGGTEQWDAAEPAAPSPGGGGGGVSRNARLAQLTPQLN